MCSRSQPNQITDCDCTRFIYSKERKKERKKEKKKEEKARRRKKQQKNPNKNIMIDGAC